MSPSVKVQSKIKAAEWITAEITAFVNTSHLNRMPPFLDGPIFDSPIVHFADGDDPLFARYKTIIAPVHLTPREALAKAYAKNENELPERLSVISWILPMPEKTRKSNRTQTVVPSRPWSYSRSYGEQFHETLRQYVVNILESKGYLAVAPISQPFFESFTNEKGRYSNWSERHIAFVAGLGTFSLTDGFITERGIAHRVSSVVTDMPLPPSRRKSDDPYSNCLFYANGSCKACIARCPVGAISEKGHDKIKCRAHLQQDLAYLLKELGVGDAGCGLCFVKVPCESCNPTKKGRV